MPGVARAMMTVMVSVARIGAHQPPLVLISAALWPAMVVFAFGMRHAEKPLALHLTRTPAGGRTRTGYSQVWAIRPGLALATHGARSRLDTGTPGP